MRRREGFKLIIYSLLTLILLPLTFAEQRIQGALYIATIDDNGLLSSLKIGDCEVIRNQLEFCPVVNWEVESVEKSEEGIAYKLQSEKGGAEISYSFTENRIKITLTHRLGGFQTWRLNFNQDVLALENLQNNTVKGAEAIQYLDEGEIRPLPVPRLSRVQRARLYLRNGAQILFWHSGWGAPFNLDEIGSFFGYTYQRNLLESNQPMSIYFQIEAKPSKPLEASPSFIPYGDAGHNLFYQGEPISFTIKFPDDVLDRLRKAQKWRIAWEVRDFWDKKIGEGKKEFDSSFALENKSVKISFNIYQRGWFSVLFSLMPVSKTKIDFLPSQFRARFAVVRDLPIFPKRVSPSEQYNMSDYYYSSLLGLRCVRESHNISDYFPEKGKARWDDLDRIFENANREAKRWSVKWFFQANSRPSWCSEEDYEQIAFQIVNRYKDKCKIWEVENEPNFSYSPQDYIQKALIPFSKGAKRADPTCQVIAPACVSVHHTLRFLEAMREVNALDYVDGISTHTYHGPGEPWEMFGNPYHLNQMKRIAPDKPIWQTEQGYWWDNVSKQRFARYVVRQFLNALAVGIPLERHFYYYVVHHGFEPMYLVEMGSSEGYNGTLEPGGVAVRIMNEEIGSRKLASFKEPLFGVYLLRFEGKDEDVIAIWTLDFKVRLKIRGKILYANDFMGNRMELKKEGDIFSIDVDGYPCYLHLRRGEMLSVIEPHLGRNLTSEEGCKAFASSSDEHHPPENAIDGKWSTLYPTPPGQEEWIGTFWQAGTEGASESSPVWLTVQFPRLHTLHYAIVLTPLPAITAVPRDFLLQISLDGKSWKTISQVKDGEEWAYFFSFPKTKARFLRLLITKLNDGWHLDGRWMFMVNENFKKYTNMKASVLELMVFGTP
ncbi:discoidin domain-containing protein [bacterium]|nr:discoidin domain-containing protein [bacterium]